MTHVPPPAPTFRSLVWGMLKAFAIPLLVLVTMLSTWLNVRHREALEAKVSAMTEHTDMFCRRTASELRLLSWRVDDIDTTPARQQAAALSIIDPRLMDAIEFCGEPRYTHVLIDRDGCYVKADYLCLGRWARQEGDAIDPPKR